MASIPTGLTDRGTGKVLILGGTRDARGLAALLLAKGHHVVTSLAGVTEQPVLPPGEVRRGGFGGAEGLAAYLAAQGFSALVDATHPFAAQMSANAAVACRGLSLPLLRLERPAWMPGVEDRWTSATTVAEAAALLPAGARVLLTIGRKEVAPFFTRADISGIARMIEQPPDDPPPGWQVLRERPPFTLAAEEALMAAQAITHLVTKNAGGEATAAKLAAARARGIPVVMVDRPAKPEVPCFAAEGALAEALERLLSP